MNDQETLQYLIDNPNVQVDPEWVDRMMTAYPTFYLPAVLLIKRNPDSVDAETLERLKAQVMLNCADRLALADLVDLNDADWTHFYPEIQPTEVTTEQTIDDFIGTYGQPSTPEEDSLLERLIFNPVPADYFAEADIPFDPDDPLALPPELMPREVPEADKEEEDNEKPKKEKETKNTTPESNNSGDESLLMESLAKIFIKQRRYERAYEIISKLSLKFPEKSVYFADQKRFLQKLIINQQFLKSKT